METQVQKGRLMFYYEHGKPASDRTWLYAKLVRYLHSFDMENGCLQILWTAKTVYAKLVNTLYFSAINKSYKIHIFVWRSSEIKWHRIVIFVYRL